MSPDSEKFNDTDSSENHDEENDDNSIDDNNSDNPFAELTHIPEVPSTHPVNESESDEIEDGIDDDHVVIGHGE